MNIIGLMCVGAFCMIIGYIITMVFYVRPKERKELINEKIRQSQERERLLKEYGKELDKLLNND
jgi:hypothetical protein